MEFSHELALSLLESDDSYPIDFDDAWKWIGYSTKQKARNKLFHNFEPEIDYTVLLNQMGKQTGRGGHNREQIRLTIDCFKSLAMMAGTSKGKEVRQYFLKCERIAKQAVKVIPAQAQEIERLKLELELSKIQERLLMKTQAIATLHGSEMLALMMGKPDAIVTRTERVETLVAVDGKGHAREAPPPLRERFFRWGWDYISCQEIWLREKYLCLSLLAQNRWSIRRTVDNRTDIGQVPKVAEGFITVARSPTRSQGGN
jgi:anti-repressor protein